MKAIEDHVYQNMLNEIENLQNRISELSGQLRDYEDQINTDLFHKEQLTLERDVYFKDYKDADKRCGKVGALYEEYKALYEKTLGRVNGLEEWLTEYRDDLKKGNVYHKNQGIINAINELLNGE